MLPREESANQEHIKIVRWVYMGHHETIAIKRAKTDTIPDKQPGYG